MNAAVVMMGLTNLSLAVIIGVCVLFLMAQIKIMQKDKPQQAAGGTLGLFRAGWVPHGSIGRTIKQAEAEGYEGVYMWDGEERTFLVFLSTQLTRLQEVPA